MNSELVLVVGDCFVPQRICDINEQFKSALKPDKINHILCLGNMGSNEQYEWLKTLSTNYHCVKGDYDFDESLPDKKCVQIGEFKIGMIHGHQVFPAGDLNSLADVQRELGCDILCHGYTHELSINAKNNALFLNPGSISGTFSPSFKQNYPSFILIALQGDIANIFFYILKDETQKFEVKRLEYTLQTNEFRDVDEEDDDE